MSAARVFSFVVIALCPASLRGQVINASFETAFDRYVRAQPSNGVAASSWQGNAWRGERLHSQIVVWSEEDIDGLSYSLPGLSGAAGSIASDSIRIEALEYVQGDMQPLSCNADRRQSVLVADALSPTSVTALSGAVPRRFWVSIDVPADAVPGDYTGELVISGSDAQPVALDLSLAVASPALPAAADWQFHLDLWQHPAQALQFRNSQGVQPIEVYSQDHLDLVEPFYRNLADHGQKAVSVHIKDQALGQPTMVRWTRHADETWSFDFTAFDRYVEAMASWGIDAQINAFSPVGWNRNLIPYFDAASGQQAVLQAPIGSSAYNQVWGDFLTDFQAHLEQKGWFDKTVLYMDEVPESEMRSVIDFLKSHNPDWKIGLAYGRLPSQDIRDDLYDASGILEAAPFDTDANEADRVRTFYTSCTQTHPNSYVTPENNPAEMVWLAWHAAARGYDGYLRWAYDNWKQPDPLDARDGGFTAGDFALVYRSSNEDGMTPIDSVRLAMLREGIEDYEKIRLLSSGEAGLVNPQDLTLLNRVLRQFEETSSGGSGEQSTALVENAREVLQYVSSRVGLGQGQGVTLLDHEDFARRPISGDGARWEAYNGPGLPGSFHGFGSGDISTIGVSYDDGIWMYPFDNGNPEFETPLLATVKSLAPAEQFHTSDFDQLIFEWELIAGQTAGVHFVINVDGVWYYEDQLTFGSGDSFVGARDGSPATVVFDPAASNWTILELTGDPDPTGVSNSDTVAVLNDPASDLEGLVMGYGFFNQLADLDETGGIDLISFTAKGIDLLQESDFDGDGDVDLTDLMIWQRGFGLTGQTGNANGDASGDGFVDAIDFFVWQSQFGDESQVPDASVAVPEPCAAVLASLGVLATWLRTAARRRARG